MRSRTRPVEKAVTRTMRWGALLVLVVAVAACQANNVPTAYGDVTRQSFMETCTGNVPDVQGTTTTLASSGYCGCAYQVFVDLVPYDDGATGDPKYSSYQAAPYHPTYQQLNTDLQENANKIDELPDPVKGRLKECTNAKEVVTSGSTPPGSTPGGSTPPGSVAAPAPTTPVTTTAP